MNRILLEKAEVGEAGRARLNGQRAAHVLDVLHAQAGQELQVGIVDGPLGIAKVLATDSTSVELACTFTTVPPQPRIDLLLALPRPKVMKRLWAALASLGVGHIVLVNAEKVERCYFDSHWLDERFYRPRLLEGLEQSGDTRVPAVTVCKRLKPFVEDELGDVFPGRLRLVAAPGERETFRQQHVRDHRGILLAVGPEGGWTEYEHALLSKHGFTAVGMGWRTLRSDTACIAAIALAADHFEKGQDEFTIGS